MQIGLIDVDGHRFPSIPLMKLSAWHKMRGDIVERASPLNRRFDVVYMAKVFDFTPDYQYNVDSDRIIKGGTGYGLDSRLPDEVESTCPDYCLYPQYSSAYGFLTRGCPRDCPFCMVSQKEGTDSRKVADLSDFWTGQKEIKLLDPNFLACPDRESLLKQLIQSRAWVDFTQGLDIRLMSCKLADMIMACRIKSIHFAWDQEKDSDLICRQLMEFKRRSRIDERKAHVYVLTNYNTSMDFDLYRVYTLKKLGFTPYIMIYDKTDASQTHRDIQRWVNNKIIFRSCERFEDYRHVNVSSRTDRTESR